MNVSVLGAGITGLAAAYEMLNRGFSVDLYEIDSKIGGITRSIIIDNYIFDIGPHILHTKNPTIRNLLERILGNQLIKQKFNAKIYLEGELKDYPPNLLSLLLSSHIENFKAVYDYSKAKVQKRYSIRSSDLSFRDWVSSKVGETIYKMYFSDYTAKLWGADPKFLTSNWAPERISIRLRSKSFFGNEWQAYPKFGIGMISNRLSEIVTQLGGKIHTQSRVEELAIHNGKVNRVVFNNSGAFKKSSTDAVISTIPITELANLLKIGTPNLKFRSIVCVFILIDRPQALKSSHWIYFPSKKVIFNRVYEPKKFSSYTVPASNKTSLCVECVCNYDDKIWQMSQSDLIDLISDQLEEYGILAKNKIIKYITYRIKYAYPINLIGYEKELNNFHNSIKNVENLFTAGRNGNFLYMNMDVAISDGIKTAKEMYRFMNY